MWKLIRMMAAKCSACGGSGQKNGKDCPTCGGTGTATDWN